MSECDIPAVNASQEEERKIFSDTKTIAVVGLSPDATKDSHRIAKYLIEQGFNVIPVYPKGDNILGRPVFKSLADIPEKVDMANLFVNSARVPEIADQAIARRDVKTLWMQSGIVNNEAAQKAKSAGINVVQNRCVKVEHQKWLGENR